MPNIVVIAGPNGAGKSTLAPRLIKEVFGEIEFLNADLIAAEIQRSSSSKVEIEAGRIMLRRIEALADHGVSFAFETTLAARSYVRLLRRLHEKDYTVQIIYLWLHHVDLAIERVAERVRMGGHDIPEATIRRRFDRGKQNFMNLYRPMADAWRVYDASEDSPELIGFGDKLEGEKIIEKALWKRITTK